MAEKKKEEGPLVSVLNRGRRTYHLRDKSLLKPGAGAQVSAEEWAELSGYKDLVDASKVVKIPGLAEMQKDNAVLRGRVAELEAKLEELEKKPKK